LHSDQDIETGLEIEVAKIDISSHLKVLMQEGKRRPGANVRGPIPALRRSRKPVNSFQVQRYEVRDFSEVKLSARAKKDAGAKNRAQLRVHAEHEEFRIESSSGPHSKAPAPGFTLNVTFHIADRLWNWRSLGAGSLLIFWGRLEGPDSDREPRAGLDAGPRFHSDTRADWNGLRLVGITVKRK